MALTICALVEVSLRAVGPEALVAYEHGLEGRYTVRHHILAYGAADVCFLGSSRTNHGIVCPTVRELLASEGSGEISVSNYATGGAQISELVPLARFLLRHGRPRVIAFGVEPQMLRSGDDVNERSAIFWDFQDYLQARARFGGEVDKWLPQVVRNTGEQFFLTLRARGRPPNLLRELVNGHKPHPVRGELLSPAHTVGADETFDDTSIPLNEIRTFVENEYLVGGQFAFSAERISMVDELINVCGTMSIPILFFELPSTELYNEQFPPDTRARFLREFSNRERRSNHVDFVSLEDLALRFTNLDFRDTVHLNLSGADRMSREVAVHIRRILSRQHLPRMRH